MSRDEHIAKRTAAIRADIARVRAVTANPNVWSPDHHAAKATLAALEEQLAHTIEAAGAEWDRMQRPPRPARMRPELESALVRLAASRARWSR
jgi:hypothetical protein